MLTQKAIEEFQEIYLQTYGKELSFAEATEQALRLIRFCKFALGYPIHSPVRDGETENRIISNGASNKDGKDE
jgi:hypothetical protein